MKLIRWKKKNMDKPIKLKYELQKSGGKHMENVLVLDDYKNETKTECEWDVISDIFTKAIKRKGLNRKQTMKMIEDIEREVRDK